ncbi:hypothetical protein EHW64_19465 [Erwinia psidii]|uniref:hypothetical protein n=1 Tax=Erwinia psidii TaxID=69224 RepID=UPI00226B14F7|nr:hypothetical protein [Erwinia psidii]MCX8963230.1 hypothetical protein [Erwinia psidii]
MKIELDFQPATAVPMQQKYREIFLVVHPGDGYYLGNAFYDENGTFICFIIEGVNDNTETLHAGQYLTWASLPHESIILNHL